MTQYPRNHKPLSNITVVSLEHAIAAPFCTRQLADLGARVIKIERPDGGDFARHYDERVAGMASHFVWINRGKESLALDIKRPESKAVLHALLDQADVFVQNLAPMATTRLGLDYESLKVLYPRLIVCDISGYGMDGPYANKKAYDLLIQGESGLISITGGEAPEQMAKTGNSIADISAAMYAYSSILAALILREKNGQGAHIDVSLLESLVEWMGYPLYYSYHDANPPKRTGASHATIYPYGPFKTQTGTILLGLQNEREWPIFCSTVLLQPQLINDPRFISNGLRSANRQALTTIIEQVFSTLSEHTIKARLDQAKIANAQVNTMQQVWHHPQLKARNRWRMVNSPVGPLPALIPPAQSNQFEYAMEAIPYVGQHNAQLLAELGFHSETLEPIIDRPS